MKQTKNEKILYRVKGNKFLFVVKNIWNVFWYAIGILLSIGFGTILLSGLSGIFRNDGQMNPVILNFGLLMIPLLILIRIIHIIFLRKNQFYIITEHGITSEGGFLTRFEQTLRMEEIQSVSFTQTLIQQILGCGNIVISSAATYRAGIVPHRLVHQSRRHRGIHPAGQGKKHLFARALVAELFDRTFIQATNTIVRLLPKRNI